MSRFLLKLVLFLLPVATLFALPFYVYWQGREFTSVDEVLQAQDHSYGTLFSLAYSSVNRTYKETLISEHQPEVVALGSSRVHQFRNFFFTPSASFENASNAVVTLSDMTRFVEALPQDSRVHVLIVGLDQRYFDPSTTLASETEQITPFERFEAFLAGSWRAVYADYFEGKFALSRLDEAHAASSNIGVLALVNDNGFLADGSYYDGKAVRDPNRLTTLAAAAPASAQYNAPASAASIEALKAFFTACDERHIHVVAFLPPYSEATDATYRSALADSLTPLSKQFKVDLYDYSNGAVVGIKPSEYVDVLHATDKAYARILIDMASRDAVLKPFVDIRPFKRCC